MAPSLGYRDAVHALRELGLEPGVPVLADAHPDQGPLAGVLAGLHWAAQNGASRLLTVPGDTPFLPGTLVETLLREARSAGTPGACARSAERRHPLVGLWDVALESPLTAFLAAGERTVERFLAAHAFAVADFPPGPPDPFMNVNTPEDLARAKEEESRGVGGEGQASPPTPLDSFSFLV